MIAPSTGEVGFADGLCITAHALIVPLLASLPAETVSERPLPVAGWRQHRLGEHTSSGFGAFTVQLATSDEQRVEAVFLSHNHSFYLAGTPEDSERRAFHEGVIATDLVGQREFPWGYVFCIFNRDANRSWLAVIYSPFSGVPLQEREVYRALMAHEPTPDE